MYETSLRKFFAKLYMPVKICQTESLLNLSICQWFLWSVVSKARNMPVFLWSVVSEARNMPVFLWSVVSEARNMPVFLWSVVSEARNMLVVFVECGF